jgi:hypothetical protein
LDLNDMQHYDPSKSLPDYNHSSVAPGWAYPRPNPWQPEPPWTFQTQRPVDIRDIMEVPPGGSAVGIHRVRPGLVGAGRDHVRRAELIVPVPAGAGQMSR